MEFKEMLQISAFMVFTLLLISFSSPVQGQDLGSDDSFEKNWENMEQVLYQLVNAENRENFAEKHDIFYRDGKVRVVLETENGKALDSRVEVEARQGDLVQGLVSVDNLLDLSESDGVMYIRTPRTGHPMDSGGEGDGFPSFSLLSVSVGVVIVILVVIYLWRLKYG